jgi:RNA polymerase sigma factor (TIGR02999 family)
VPDLTISETTQLLRAWAGGNQQALENLTPHVYRELRRLAAHHLQNERVGLSLQPTELVHELYLRLVNVNQLEWQHRAHFFAVAAKLMRQILVDRARHRLAAKRGGKQRIVGLEVVDLEQTLDLMSKRSSELVALDDALNALAAMDNRKARIVELRFFAGLGVKETAEVVGVSADTVTRDWKLARAWLMRELNAAEG